MSTDMYSKVEEPILRAVQDCIRAGCTPEQFRNFAAAIWRDELHEQAARAERELST